MSRLEENHRIILIGIIKKYKYILENKKTDSSTNNEKNQCWETVTKEYNSQIIGPSKTTKQLKAAYANWKGKIRREIAGIKSDTLGSSALFSTVKLSEADVELYDLIMPPTDHLRNTPNNFDADLGFRIKKERDISQGCDDVNDDCEYQEYPESEFTANESTMEQPILAALPPSGISNLSTRLSKSRSIEEPTDEVTTLQQKRKLDALEYEISTLQKRALLTQIKCNEAKEKAYNAQRIFYETRTAQFHQ